ncbi:MAG TPA: hypothetical protein VIN77_03835 [Aurantimonas sp.]
MGSSVIQAEYRQNRNGFQLVLDENESEAAVRIGTSATENADDGRNVT